MAEIKHIEGIHNDGTVDAIITFELAGEIAHDQVTIPYQGARPTQDELDKAARVLTNCATAKVTSYAIIDQGFSEDQYTCPNAKHILPMNPATGAVPNYYEPAQKCALGSPIVVKIKKVTMMQTTRSGYSYPNQ